MGPKRFLRMDFAIAVENRIKHRLGTFLGGGMADMPRPEGRGCNLAPDTHLTPA
jgi:hypothetical protein